MEWFRSTQAGGRRINDLVPLSDARALIEAGAYLMIAGRPEALASLPRGNWIGGTTPYVMTERGGCVIANDQVFLTDFSGIGQAEVKVYDCEELELISQDAPRNGFALTIIPFQSRCHERFAAKANTYPTAYLKPVIGWISGFDLTAEDGQALVLDGISGQGHQDRAVVLHVEMPSDFTPIINMINLFEPDDEQTFHFEEVSFSPSHILIDGVRTPFADYIRKRAMEHGRLPLVGGFSGAHINASIYRVHGDTVDLYAPVHPGIPYSFARPVADYAREFRRRFESGPRDSVLWTCNCILNFVFGELEGKALGSCAGPVTFGEIAHQLVNQTLVEIQVL